MKPKKFRFNCGVQPSNLELASPGGTLELSWIWAGPSTDFLEIQESEAPHHTWVTVVASVPATDLFVSWFTALTPGVFAQVRARRIGSYVQCFVKSDVQEVN